MIDWELLLSKAITVAASAHAGQKDKAHKPYILHPLRVMMKMEDTPSKVIAVLHDVLEDSGDYDEQYFLEEFGEWTLEVLKLLTHKRGQPYDEYIQNLLKDRTARGVKLADLEDNIDPGRLPVVTDKDLKRIEKYHRAMQVIKEANRKAYLEENR